MDRQLKQRVIGAAVLVALGVIFIPIVLDDGDLETRLPEVADIPERPDGEFVSRIVPLDEDDIDALQAKTRLPVEPPLEHVTLTEAPPEDLTAGASASGTQSADEPPESPPSSEPAVESAASAEANEVEPAGIPDESAPAPEGSDAQSAVAGAAWAVQVGSFSSESNARGLEARLREAGLPAYVRRQDADGAVAFKVRVGPQQDRTEARTMRTRLASEFDLKGLLLSYP